MKLTQYPFSRWSCLSFLIGLATIFSLSVAFAEKAPDISKLLPEELKAVRFMQTAVVFKKVATTNLSAAVDGFAAGKTPAKRLKKINDIVMKGLDPTDGWTVFLRHSILSPAALETDVPVCFIYNPWVDAVIATAWRDNKDSFSLLDLELITGTTVRTGEQTGSSTRPGWLEADGFLPLRAAHLVTDTVNSGTKFFSTPEKKGFRARLGQSDSLKNPAKQQYPYVRALLGFYANLSVLYEKEATSGDAAFGQCRAMTQSFIEGGARGKVEALLKQTPDSLPSAKRLLTSLPPRWYTRLEQVAFVDYKTEQVVILSPVLNSGCLVSLMYDKKSTPPALKRVDFVDFATFSEICSKSKEGPK